MRINTLFTAAMAMVALLVSGICVVTLEQAWNDYDGSRAGANATRTAGIVLRAQEKISLSAHQAGIWFHRIRPNAETCRPL